MTTRLKATVLVLKKMKPTLSIKQRPKTIIELIWLRILNWSVNFFLNKFFIAKLKKSLKADLDDADDDGGDDADEENDGCIYCI